MKNKCAEAAEWYSIFVPISAMRGLLADTQTEQTGDELIAPDYCPGRVKVKYERKGCRGEGRR